MLAAAALAALALVSTARAHGADPAADEALMQDLSKASLDTLNRDEEKRRFMNTITVEKMRIQQTLLRNTFESALDLYRSGEYEGAQELATQILAIDPSFEDAAMLKNAAAQLKGNTHGFSGAYTVVDQRFKQALDLYQQNRLVEAQRAFQEVIELAPAHLKARYWLHRVQGELADVHYARGAEAYEAGELQKCLDHWYAALMLNPSYPKLVDSIQRVEAEKRRRDANRLMQQAVAQVGQGQTAKSIETLNQLLALNPGDPKARGMLDEIRNGAAEKNIAAGRRLYQQRKFDSAITEWNKALQWGYDPDRVKSLVTRAQEMIAKEKESKEKAIAAAAKRKQDAEEAAKKKAAEEEEAKAKAAEGGEGPAGGSGGEGSGELNFKLDTGAGGAEKPASSTSTTTSKEVEGKRVIAAGGDTSVSPEQQAKVNEANKREALQHYQQGMVYMQNRQIDQAKHELDEAKKLDPSNLEVDAALRRIDAIVQGQ